MVVGYYCPAAAACCQLAALGRRGARPQLWADLRRVTAVRE